MASARHALWGTIAVNILVFAWNKDKAIEYHHLFSVRNQTLSTMLVSMFMHGDDEHLITNMIGLAIYGRRVFQKDHDDNTSGSIWKDPLLFLTLYFGSGIGGFLGVSMLSSWHERQWQSKLAHNRQALAQTMTWLWGSGRRTGRISQSLADTFTYVTNWYSATNKFMYNAMPRIGASGAVYGVLGARVYTDLLAPKAAPQNHTISTVEVVYLATQIALEVAHCPLRLESIDVFMLENVDHVAHAAGFFSGMLLAAAIERWSLSWWTDGRRRQGRRQ